MWCTGLLTNLVRGDRNRGGDEALDTLVGSVGDVEVALAIYAEAPGGEELAGSVTRIGELAGWPIQAVAPLIQHGAICGQLLDAPVVTVAHEDVAGLVHRHAARAVELAGRGAGIGA